MGHAKEIAKLINALAETLHADAEAWLCDSSSAWRIYASEIRVEHVCINCQTVAADCKCGKQALKQVVAIEA